MACSRAQRHPNRPGNPTSSIRYIIPTSNIQFTLRSLLVGWLFLGIGGRHHIVYTYAYSIYVKRDIVKQLCQLVNGYTNAYIKKSPSVNENSRYFLNSRAGLRTACTCNWRRRSTYTPTLVALSQDLTHGRRHRIVRAFIRGCACKSLGRLLLNEGEVWRCQWVKKPNVGSGRGTGGIWCDREAARRSQRIPGIDNLTLLVSPIHSHSSYHYMNFIIAPLTTRGVASLSVFTSVSFNLPFSTFDPLTHARHVLQTDRSAIIRTRVCYSISEWILSLPPSLFLIKNV